MSELAFACDRPVESAIEQMASRIASVPARSSWALVDLALIYGDRFARAATRHGWNTYNAYASTDLAAFGQHAPHWIALPSVPDGLRETLVQLLRCIGEAPAISVVSTDAGIQQLIALSATLATVRVEQRTAPVHCRFADTRVLPELLDILSPEQRTRIGAIVRGWSWFDRLGQLAQWTTDGADVAGDAPLADASTGLHLSIAQFRAMQSAAEADGMFKLLLDTTPEIVPAQGRGAFHNALQRHLVVADELQLVDARDRFQFVVLGLTCSEHFYRLAAVVPAWRAAAADERRLSASIAAWADEVWGAIQ